MLSRKSFRIASLCGLVSAALAFVTGSAHAQQACGSNSFHCQRMHCPPGLKHCMERAPHIHFMCGCPRPICDPCKSPNWGYFEPCWNPWPWAPDFSHCRTLPPAATIGFNPGPPVTGFPVSPLNQGAPETTLPAPRQLR